MKTYKIAGNGFVVTMSALACIRSTYFDTPVVALVGEDWEWLCSFPESSVEITEM